ncbi:MAG: 2-keto-4-pentenoate hydratase [Gammaproteobacteria bacterium]|nr:2-keto-4-pentenoate hydratase [Gammaproteobacteria bacterium]
MDGLEQLIPWFDEALNAPALVPDIRQRKPDITPLQAYRLQAGIMAARVARGDRIAGYKAALTSAAMRAQIGVPEPLLGTLLASKVFPEDEPVSLCGKGFLRATLEPEIAVVLGAELQGPGVDAVQALSASAGYLPAIELGDYRAADAVGHTLIGSVVCNTFNGGIVLGRPLTPPAGIDLRVEGMSLRVNGVPAGSGTGIEVLGDPLNSVAFMANKLAELGLGLRAGMVLMTGSIIASIAVAPGDHAEVAFTRLGTVQVRIAD